ncbi:DUF2057 family protein [[Enterobacter] lignolyticus]|uniref:Uncharacterized protein n=1 Tax=[Enterobacter] lignolyticus TaxID=1334193 RepID=A0A806X5Y7_9ENTR|nr:DUF2057 family protein [[Enterobacter] lignolyticus]ALR76242.1 hypothetical protein AO703_08005 [[Enterobacter] lignolyticus]
MKAIIMTLYLLLLPAGAIATTLHLSGDVDLLVLDGKEVSSLLLRGAESIELDNGPHQLVFRVERMVRLPDNNRQLYVSPVLIASFDSRQIDQVNFSLPELETLLDAQTFTFVPSVKLLDGNAAPIPAKLSILAITQAGDDIDYEKAARLYNQTNPPPAAAAWQPQSLTEQRLKHWFELADPQTRHRFLEWAKRQPSS